MAMEGYLDFSDANLFDHRWHAKVNLFMREYNSICEERLMLLDLKRVLSKLLVAAFANKPDAVSKVNKLEGALFEKLAYKMFGLDKDQKPAKSETQQAKELWISEFGDLDSPETQKQIDAVVNWLKNR